MRLKNKRIRYQNESFTRIKQLLLNNDENNVFIGMNLLKQLDYRDLVAFGSLFNKGSRSEYVTYKGRALLIIEKSQEFITFIFKSDYLDNDIRDFRVWFKIKTIGLDKSWMKKRVAILHKTIDYAIKRIDDL